MNYRPLGGSEYYFLTTTSLLEAKGHRIAVVKPSGEDCISVKGRPEYDIPSAMGVRTTFRAWNVLSDVIDREKPDIALIHNVFGFLSPGIVKRLRYKLPVAMHVHDARLFCPGVISKVLPDDSDCNFPFSLSCFTKGCFLGERKRNPEFSTWKNQSEIWVYKWMFMAETRKMDGLIVGSSYMKDQLILNDFPRDRIHVAGHMVYRPVENVQAAHTMQRIDSDKEGAPIILFVGRFDGIKGLEKSVDMLLSLKIDIPWKARFIGNGPGLRNVKAEVEASGMEERFEFIHRVERDEMNRIFSEAAIFVMPSLIPESFGVAGAEALAEGTPVIAFDSGGIEEWMEDARFGFMVPRGDFDEMKKRIILLLGNRDMRIRMGDCGRKRMMERFTPENHISVLENILERIIVSRNMNKRYTER